MDPDPPMPPPSRSPVLRVSTSSSSLAPSRGLLASPSMSSASTSFSNRKSVARNLKAHIVSVKIQDPSDDIESVDMQATVQEDDSTTFGELFESLCKSTFRSHNGHSALSKGLKEVRLFGTQVKEDHAVTTVSPDILINTLHVLFLHVNQLVFVLKAPAVPNAKHGNASSSPPSSPRSKKRPSIVREFTFEETNLTSSLLVKSTINGDQGVYASAIASPTLEVTIHEVQNQVFDDIFTILCSTVFAPHQGEDALARGLARVIVSGKDHSKNANSEALKADASLSMAKYMFATIGMEEEKKEEKTLLLSPEKRTSSVPNIMGWTITKPITHHPQIILRDESNEIAEVSVKIALSDATNITFSDLFFVHCTKSFAGKGGELAIERGLAKIVLEGIALSQGVLLEGGIATGGLSLTEEFSHQAKVSSIKRTFEKVERVIFFVRQEEEKKEGAKVFALPNKKSLANTVLARYVKIQRLYNHHQHIHINQLEVFDEKNSKLKPIKSMLHPQHGKALHHGGNLLSDGNYDEVDAKGKPRYAKTGNTKDAYMELDFGRDFHISKVLIFNLLSSPESLIGTVLVLTNEKNKVVFVCPISTSMKLYQIRPIPRAKVDNPYPIQPVAQQPTNDVIDLKLPLREDEKKMEKTCCSWLMSVCCCCCIPAVGIPLDVTKQDTPTKKRQSVDPIPSPPRSPRDKITLPLEWSAAIVGDYEVCPAAKQKYFGYEGDVYEGYQRNEAEGEGMGIWENL